MTGEFYICRNKEQRENACRWVMQYPDDTVMVKVGKYKAPKSHPQLEKIHAMIRDIAVHMEVPEEQVKGEIKVKFGVTIVYTSIIDGTRKARLKSFADYTRKEMTATIEALQVWCAEQGIRLSA